MPRRSAGTGARWALVLLLGLLPVGCRDRGGASTSASPRGPDPRRGFIAFVGAGRNDPLWPILEAGARRHLELASTIDIRFFCPNGDSAQAQLDLLRSLRDPDMRGICIEVRDPDALRHQLGALHTRGIPIVSMLRPVPEENRAGHVGLDDPGIGRALGQETAWTVGDGGSVILLHAGDMDPIYGPRKREFEQVMKEHPGVDLLARLDCRGDPREARALIRDWAQRYPRVSAWVALDDWPLRDHPEPENALPAGARLITFGGTPEQWPLIRNGVCPAVVTADYHEMGSRAAQFCESAVREAAVPGQLYFVPVRSVSAANLDEYERDWKAWAASQPAAATGEE